MAKTLRIAAWNLNHRVGTTRYRPEAAHAAAALEADLIVLTEYFPRARHAEFLLTLAVHGYPHALLSPGTREQPNRVLIAARTPIETFAVETATFDNQMPANALAVREVSSALVLLGVRVPWYERNDSPRLSEAWAWLERIATSLTDVPAVIAGDLNISMTSKRRRGSVQFQRILTSGWTRAQPPEGVSFPYKDGGGSEIDHVLVNRKVRILESVYVSSVVGRKLAGERDALSDHNAVLATIRFTPEPPARPKARRRKVAGKKGR
jgi:endonuclease/exonuclease/phosphatase family metal-dependent hydrolase